MFTINGQILNFLCSFFQVFDDVIYFASNIFFLFLIFDWSEILDNLSSFWTFFLIVCQNKNCKIKSILSFFHQLVNFEKLFIMSFVKFTENLINIFQTFETYCCQVIFLVFAIELFIIWNGSSWFEKQFEVLFCSCSNLTNRISKSFELKLEIQTEPNIEH